MATVTRTRPISCVHCSGTGREVQLWNQIIAFERGTVCCWTSAAPLPAPARGRREP